MESVEYAPISLPVGLDSHPSPDIRSNGRPSMHTRMWRPSGQNRKKTLDFDPLPHLDASAQQPPHIGAASRVTLSRIPLWEAFYPH